jgi:hypothetical protein
MVLTQKERKKYFPKRILAIIYQPVLQMRKYFLRIWILPCHFCGHRTYYIVKTSRYKIIFSPFFLLFNMNSEYSRKNFCGLH